MATLVDSGSTLVDPIADPRWSELLERSPDASIFHHPRWLSLLAEQYGYRLMACVNRDGDSELRQGLPIALVSSRLTGRRLVALPFSDVCAPVGDGGADGLAGPLEELARELGLGLCVHGEVPGLPANGDGYLQHLVALEPDVEAVQRRFTRRAAMQGARRAQREGVVVEQRTDAQALAAFYRLHLATRRRQGVPTQPRSFIMAFASLFEHGLGFVSLASIDGRPVSAAVFLVFNGVLTYKYGASDARYLDRRPNNLLFAEAIRRGCEQGLHTLDLGRTDLGHESLRSFKLLWGAQELQLRYTSVGRAAGAGRGSATPAVLQTLIRRAPESFGRGVGRLLYRHVG